MANEAVIIELLGEPKGCPIRYTCNSAVTISGGTLLKLVDPRNVSGGNLAIAPRGFAGIAAHDKDGNDTSTSIAVYTKGIFDLVAGGAFLAGDLVMLSGGGVVSRAENPVVLYDAISGGRLVGRALETATDGEVVAVAVGVY